MPIKIGEIVVITSNQKTFVTVISIKNKAIIKKQTAIKTYFSR
jgi:hypothetical protein